MRWLPPVIGPLFRHPVRVARDVHAFRTGRLTLRALDLRVNGLSFLRLVMSEARAQGFEPFLLWGTLLGCTREGGLIRGDHDLDLGVMATDAAHLPKFRDRMKRRGFGVRIENEHKLSLVHPRHPRLYIDIDVVSPHRGGWSITNPNADSGRRFRYHFPAQVFADTKPASFAGLSVRVPHDPEGFLTAVYGDWRIPSVKTDYRYGPLNTEVELVAQPELRTLHSGERSHSSLSAQ
jgi:hypothetical protein